jgi:hypothetical protein
MGNQNCREQGRRDAKAGKYVKNHPGHKNYVAKVGIRDQSAYNQGHKEGSKNRGKGKGGGCFLTTACTQYAGLPDDCRELTTLRRFRDTYVMSLPDGAEVVTEYYNSAPILLKYIDSSDDRVNILSDIFRSVSTTVELVESGQCEKAKAIYASMFRNLKERFGID